MLLTAVLLCLAQGELAPEQALIDAARDRHGELGERAARFLVEHMPPGDRGALPAAFLIENLELAFAARAEFPWAAALPEERFFEDVLPYAVLDEPRHPWRAELLELARPLVAEAKSASEAAQALNARLFDQFGLHYHTGRKRPNQSFRESREQGKATCTGLSIVLVEACRAVGIPARAVGTPLWTNGRGNHTWVEIWDGHWRFTGADEYDPAGLDRGWFVGDAAAARADRPEHRIYASAWRRGGLCFPLAWNPRSEAVAAVDVTNRYARAQAPKAGIELGLCALESGQRIEADVLLLDPTGAELARGRTRAGRADLNDLLRFELPPGQTGSLLVGHAGAWRSVALALGSEGPATLELDWGALEPLPPALQEIESWLWKPAAERGPAPETALSAAEARRAKARLWDVRRRELAAERGAEREARALSIGERTLRWKERRFGDAPAGARSLWISMHGGGGAPPEVNDQQWENQIRLYEPAEGWYVAPRAPGDTWNLWHEAHVDGLLTRLIENFVVLEGVDPERVYLLGYSAGGDGVWQLAPRLADRFAAAAMMAGHPNEAQLDGLSNLPFALLMGAEDKAYGRAAVASERAQQLASLAAAHPGEYPHFVRIYPGLGHWMQRQDAEALPWMAGFTRRSWPRRLVWLQDDVTHGRAYWLGLPAELAEPGRRVEAEVDGQRIQIRSPGLTAVELWLDDALLDLDQPLEVWIEGQRRFSGTVQRSARVLWDQLAQRADPRLLAAARLELDR
jgi:hypothetical protein